MCDFIACNADDLIKANSKMTKTDIYCIGTVKKGLRFHKRASGLQICPGSWSEPQVICLCSFPMCVWGSFGLVLYPSPTFEKLFTLILSTHIPFVLYLEPGIWYTTASNHLRNKYATSLLPLPQVKRQEGTPGTPVSECVTVNIATLYSLVDECEYF